MRPDRSSQRRSAASRRAADGPRIRPLDPERYRALVEHGPTLVWTSGRDGKKTYVNATWLAFTGRALADELGHGWLAGLHPDDREPCRARYAESHARGAPFELEYRLRRHDGAYRQMLVRGTPETAPDGGFAGFIGSCVDIGTRRQNDDVFGYAEFFDHAFDHLCVAGFDGYWKRLNPSWSRTLGWSTEELMSRPLIEFAHPEDREAILAKRRVLFHSPSWIAQTNRYLCKDGSYRWFEWRTVSRVDRQLVYAVARDVTDQKETQRLHREVTERLTATLNSIADGVIATDQNGTVARLNPVAATLTGWSAREAAGQPLDDVFRLVEPEGGEPPLLVARGGARRSIAFSRAPIQDGDGKVTGAVFVFRDLTAEREAKRVQEHLERQLVLADRLASVGTLAAGVAHEINNPLACVMANIDILLEEIGAVDARAPSLPTSDWISMAVDVRQGAERIRKIVRGLMTFARADEERRAVIAIEPVVELSVRMTLNQIRHRARLVQECGATPRVEADDSRLGQVFINLLVNAAQAIPEGNTEGNEVRIVTWTDAAGHAVIEFRDSGPGIPPSLLGRIFDPFFTTKPVGVGTGLGLSICHSIISSMGGQLTARNSPTGGAIFRVVLPAAGAGLDAGAASATERPAADRRAAVLVVDDERAVGLSLERLLVGHDVTVVTTAREALELIEAGRAFDLILSDLMMPEMSGMELYDALLRRRPEAVERMVFITGGAFTTAARAFLDRVPNERLDKPFDAAAIRALVARWPR